MSYFRLLGARRRSGRLPTMAPRHWTDEQRRLAAAGCCIECGGPNTGTRSYLCPECQEKMTMADIRDEIDALRRKLLN
jgi:transcription initiation factor IIE alpha subunit